MPPALDAQADPATTWLASPWFHLLDDAFALGAVDEPSERRYVTQAIGGLEIKAPAMALGDQPWEVSPTSASPRPVRGPPVVPSARIGFAAYLERLTLDGADIELDEAPSHNRTAVWREYQVTRFLGGAKLSSPSGQVAGPVAAPRPSSVFPRLLLTPGDHTITSRWRIEAFRLDPPGPVHYVRIPEKPPAVEWTWEGSHAVRAGRAAEDVVKVVRTSDFPDRHPVTLSDPDDFTSSIVVIPSNARGDRVCRHHLACPVHRVRVEGAHIVGRLVLRTADREWPLSGNVWKPGDDEYEPATVVIAPGLPPGATSSASTYLDELPQADALDLVIIPDIDAAAGRGLVGPIWGEEIVLRSVPLNVLE